MSNEIKPCPFCGSLELGTISNDHTTLSAKAVTYIICKKCGTRGPTLSYLRHEFDHKLHCGQATYLWNERKEEEDE